MNTDIYNSRFRNDEENARIPNLNVKEWLADTVQITDDGNPDTALPNTFSVYARYPICLEAPNYIVFSNKASMAQYIKEHGGEPHYGVALEEPHDAIHFSLGGLYQKGVYNADPILGANGDMGGNETAGFDPVSYLYHAFVDYAFWQWQRRHGCTAAGNLTEEVGKDGTTSLVDPVFKKGTALDTDSPLEPFKQPSGRYYTSNYVTDIENQLGYSYGPGSLDLLKQPNGHISPTDSVAKIARVSNISRSDYSGSFVIRTDVELPDGKTVEVGRDAVLSRWYVDGCSNCQGHLQENSFIAIDNKTMSKLTGNNRSEKDIKFHVRIQSRHADGDRLHAPRRQPVIEFL